ncbi:ABC transporter permease subunit [Nonomuraea jiangxiensis]|uniref:Alpha-glucoside transport system permease protein n=1 Tax=Nonomuraea jiangxiensis TaxID=633440 RepID=A0A1G8LFF0_9ACTN|nr:ABC transporter permease subunit [Nonomuraea jiangxiensis]SDI53930.1 alpha-glucoside transport system permease protein [Nonomuraea jiangxiensis]
MSERNAFLFEVAPHHDAGVPVVRHGLGRWRASAYLLLAVLLSAGIILVPLFVTVIISFSNGLTGYAVLGDEKVLQSLGNSFVWLVLAVLVCVVGLGLAWLTRNAGPVLSRVLSVLLVLPAVVSPLTTGAIFRSLFDTDPGRGPVNALLGLLDVNVAFLGPVWLWLVLGLAFVWQWAGVAFLVFRAALARMPTNLLRVTRAFGVDRRRRIWSVVVPALAGPAALAYLLALVAAARVFDLVLMGAPGSMQAEVEGAGLFWWRHHGDLREARAGALSVGLSVMVAVMALPALFGLRGRVTWGEPVAPARPLGGRRLRVACWAVSVLWALPFVVLVLTSLREPNAAALSGWWNGGPWTLGSYADALADSGFMGALGTTFLRAALVVALVLLAAVPAAYVLAHQHLLPRRGWRPALLVAVALAALPPQAFAVPLQLWLSPVVGTGSALAIVHAALVIPLAVLVLHNAFVRVSTPMLARHRWELVHVGREARPALVLAGVLAFVLVWNDTVVGLLLNWPAGDHLSLILLEQARHFVSAAAPLAAESVLATAVPLLVVAVTGRWLYRGLTQGVRR